MKSVVLNEEKIHFSVRGLLVPSHHGGEISSGVR